MMYLFRSNFTEEGQEAAAIVPTSDDAVVPDNTIDHRSICEQIQYHSIGKTDTPVTILLLDESNSLLHYFVY